MDHNTSSRICETVPAVLMSIQHKFNSEIEAGNKLVELRTRAPMLTLPFTVYTYDSGADGAHAVTNSWTCARMVTHYFMTDADLEALSVRACAPIDYIKEYIHMNNGACIPFCELYVENVNVFDEPIPLSDFTSHNKGSSIVRPPQNYLYVKK